MMAVSPSRKSSLLISIFIFASAPLDSAYAFSVRVRPILKPARCVPPSMVLMLLTYECSFVLYESLYCMAISTGTPLRSVSMYIGLSIIEVRFSSRYFTNSLSPSSL